MQQGIAATRWHLLVGYFPRDFPRESAVRIYTLLTNRTVPIFLVEVHETGDDSLMVIFWIESYPLVTNSLLLKIEIVDLPIENGDFP